SLPADRAYAALLGQQRLVLRRRQAVTALELSASKRRVIGLLAGLTGATSPFLDPLLICLVIGVAALSQLLPVRLVIGTTPRLVLGALVSVLRALLPAPCVVRGALFCIERHSLCPIVVPAPARLGRRTTRRRRAGRGPAPVSGRTRRGEGGSRHA